MLANWRRCVQVCFSYKTKLASTKILFRHTSEGGGGFGAAKGMGIQHRRYYTTRTTQGRRQQGSQRKTIPQLDRTLQNRRCWPLASSYTTQSCYTLTSRQTCPALLLNPASRWHDANLAPTLTMWTTCLDTVLPSTPVLRWPYQGTHERVPVVDGGWCWWYGSSLISLSCYVAC